MLRINKYESVMRKRNKEEKHIIHINQNSARGNAGSCVDGSCTIPQISPMLRPVTASSPGSPLSLYIIELDTLSRSEGRAHARYIG